VHVRRGGSDAILCACESVNKPLLLHPRGSGGASYTIQGGDIGHVIALDAFVC
jgi:hypothetical protein